MIGKLAFQVALAVVPIYVLIESSGYKVESFDTSGGSAVFPAAIAWFMIALTAIQMVRIVLKNTRSSASETTEPGTGFDQPVVFWGLFRGVPGVMLLAAIAYALIIPILGFVLTSILFLIGVGAFLMYKTDGRIERRPFVLRSLLFVVFSVGLYQLFMRGMRIYLPTGIFGF